MVAILDTLFSDFDELAEAHGLEKIKTIGDAYMAVAGLPVAVDDHAERAARMALQMQQILENHELVEVRSLTARIGLHSGPVVAGVIGSRKFTYDLWGDTVNLASRMESTGAPGRVQVSEHTAKALGDLFVVENRGEVDVKGKGRQKTAWLIKERE